MARRRRRTIMIPQAERGMDQLKGEVMRQLGYAVDPARPDDVKFAVAMKEGIPLQRGYNGHLSTEQAGKIGGRIGGSMVRELVRRAQASLVQTPPR